MFGKYNPFALMHAAIIKGLSKKVYICPRCHKILKEKGLIKCPKCKLRFIGGKNGNRM